MASDKKLIAYLACEILIAIVSILGNALIVLAFLRDRRLRTPTNLYIFSLAVTDLLTSAVAVPVYVFSMMTQRPRDFHSCLYVNTLILTFCTVSIFHLTAVSYDRYMAVVWRRKPVSHSRGMRHATILIGVAWLLGGLIGCLPVMGWHSGVPPPSVAPRCQFMKVVDMRYLLFLFYATIITPTVIMTFFYVSIYHAVRRHNDRMLSVHYSLDTRMSKRQKSNSSFLSWSRRSGQSEDGEDDGSENAAIDARIRSVRRRQSVKTKRVIFSLLLVIVCFLVSWYPLYIMNAVAYYCGAACRMELWWFYAPIVLSHLASAVNPFIYARTMPGYKEAFIEALACKRPIVDSDPNGNVQSLKRKTPKQEAELVAAEVDEEEEKDEEDISALSISNETATTSRIEGLASAAAQNFVISGPQFSL